MDKISALMDGELDAHQTDQQYARIKHDEEARAGWDTYHLIGDALRGSCQVSPRFREQLSARLAQEPTVLAPRRAPAKRVTAYALSAAASLSAVGFVGWMALQQQPAVVATPAPAPAAPAPQTELASVPSEGNMSQYLMAHQEFSPSTAIQGLAPYVRTVSATHTSKGRE